jgi:hypothetical protein
MPEPTAIVEEHIVYAIERLSKTAASRVFHLAWPSEFPLTLCGQLATEPLPRDEPRGSARGSECGSCHQSLADLPFSRANPHRA